MLDGSVETSFGKSSYMLGPVVKLLSEGRRALGDGQSTCLPINT